MSLSVRSSARAGIPLGGGEDWGDSLYGSLITLGPKTFKKKPVLVLAAEELAEAHLAMAMGGAEIMEMQPDPVEAPRPRQSAVILGLVPMGADESFAPPVPFVPPAPVDGFEDDEPVWEPLPDYDEPEPEEADIQTWVPEEEPEDLEEDPSDAEEAAGDHPVQQAMFTSPEPQVPSIEEQLDRMRERLAKRAAAIAAAAPDPAPVPLPVEPPRPTTIERLEIDDWSGRDSLKGFIPPQEQDLAPPPAASEPVRVEPAPAAAAQVRSEPPAPPPVVARPAVECAPEPTPAPEPVAIVAEPLDLAPFEPEPAPLLDLDDDAALDSWAEHLAPVAPPPRRHAGIRARLSDEWEGVETEEAPSLLARLWAWLRGRS